MDFIRERRTRSAGELRQWLIAAKQALGITPAAL
jgi:hypothetical protein